MEEYCAKADFVVHLAGVNRPDNNSEFDAGNVGFTKMLLDALKRCGGKMPVLITSSVQAEQDNPYGRSKKAAEDAVFEYGAETGAQVCVYRMPNVFGKWCRPNYNSAVTTFCSNIASGLPITVDDPLKMMQLVYIDDVVTEIIRAISGRPHRNNRFCAIEPVYHASLGEIVRRLYSFKEGRTSWSVPDVSDPFTAKLYAAYLSYLPENEFDCERKMNCDARGSFTELLRTEDRGQISVNISKPGIVKGNHWHHTKNEKFIVVSGQGVIRFRRIGDSKVIVYPVSGEKIEAVDIPTGYTHSIENTGNTDMVTIMWASECFDPERPDTFYEDV